MLDKFKRTGAVALALLLVVAVAGAAFAATEPRYGLDGVNSFHNFIAKFSANLGVEQEKVSKALEETRKQLLNEAVKSGEITQEQADEMATQPIEEFRLGGMHEKRYGGHLMGKDAEKILGITREQLKTEIEAGKDWEQILKDHGLTVEQYQQKMMEHRKTELRQKVSEGRITQKQADSIIEKMEERVKTCPKIKSGTGVN